MSLQDLKVGDEVVIRDVNRGTMRAPVTKVARLYFTAGGAEFSRDDGMWRSVHYQSHRRAYTIAEWERIEAEAALRAALRSVLDARRLDPLTLEEIHSFTTMAQMAAKKLA
jgi:hypothetical protein